MFKMRYCADSSISESNYKILCLPCPVDQVIDKIRNSSEYILKIWYFTLLTKYMTCESEMVSITGRGMMHYFRQLQLRKLYKLIVYVVQTHSTSSISYLSKCTAGFMNHERARGSVFIIK